METSDLAVLALGGSAAGMVYGAIKGNEAQDKLMKAQLAQERMLAARDRLSQVRQTRTAMAQVQQAGANQGVSGSSAIAGGAATAYDQGAGNIQYINNQEMYGIAQTKDRISYNDAMGIEELSKDVFSIAMSAAKGGF